MRGLGCASLNIAMLYAVGVKLPAAKNDSSGLYDGEKARAEMMPFRPSLLFLYTTCNSL